MRVLLLGLMIHCCYGVTSWAQLVFTAMDNIFLSCGSLNNVALDGRMFILDNASMLLVIVVAWKNQTGMNGSRFFAQLQVS
jgi:hypothetical protein